MLRVRVLRCVALGAQSKADPLREKGSSPAFDSAQSDGSWPSSQEAVKNRLSQDSARGRNELRPYYSVVEVKVTKNRVQPANSLQSKCFVSRAMTGGRIGGSPHFSVLHHFASGC